MQCFIVVHAYTAHLDPKLLRHRLLAGGQGAGRVRKAERTPGDPHSHPCRADPPGSTYSLRRGAALRRLAFCTMVAWFRRAMRMREAARRQGSPSTCTGMALPVVSSTSRHCVSLSPWPPTCSAACQVESVSQDWGSGTTVVLWRAGVGTGDTHTQAPHQGRHSEADDLEVAVVMPLGFKVLVFTRVAPRHGTCTVPGGREWGFSVLFRVGKEGLGRGGITFYLGMFRKTMHWGFRSWILGVRSTPSHCR